MSIENEPEAMALTKRTLTKSLLPKWGQNKRFLGTYEVKNNVIELFDRAGDDMDSVRGLGKYVISIVGEDLILKPVEDAAIYRNFILSNVKWSKIRTHEGVTSMGGGRK